MTELQDVLQASAKLYAMLGDISKIEDRDEFIEDINAKLDDRNDKIELLKKAGFKYDEQDKAHVTLFELDKGIMSRLQLVLDAIKRDLKDVQNSKKNEQQYSNPYGHVQAMDGMYYDKKK
jgi:flagellar protein FliT